jgi:hypothetical protein
MTDEQILVLFIFWLALCYQPNERVEAKTA